MVIKQHTVEDDTVKDIINTLENALKNIDLQVYSTDNKEFGELKDRLKNLFLQVYLQVWEKTTIKKITLVSDVLSVLGFLWDNNTMSLNKMLEKTNAGTSYKLHRYVLDPIIHAGYVERTDPDKPTSSKQSYRLTEKGKELLNNNNIS